MGAAPYSMMILVVHTPLHPPVKSPSSKDDRQSHQRMILIDFPQCKPPPALFTCLPMFSPIEPTEGPKDVETVMDPNFHTHNIYIYIYLWLYIYISIYTHYVCIMYILYNLYIYMLRMWICVCVCACSSVLRFFMDGLLPLTSPVAKGCQREGCEKTAQAADVSKHHSTP